MGVTGRELLVLALFVGACVTVGSVGALATSSNIDSWYGTIEKPSWNPPSWVFGPVWTTLYILMGTAAWFVWRDTGWRGEGAVPMGLFVAQLVLNGLWSPAFFGLQSPGLGFAVIVPMLALIGATTTAFFRVRRVAGWMMVPYVAWVSFATVLNGVIWQLNS